MLQRERGFTLLEILLVVAAIAILAGIVIVAINPARQLGNTRNAQRKVDIKTILSAVYQYEIDNGSFPSSIPSGTATEVCKTNAASCANMIDLNALAPTYISALPVDPLLPSTDTNGTGYTIYENSDSRIVVAAPHAELGQTISITN